MKTKKIRTKRLGNIEYTESSGNVFADLGIPNPEKALAKAEIALAIHSVSRFQKKSSKSSASR